MEDYVMRLSWPYYILIPLPSVTGVIFEEDLRPGVNPTIVSYNASVVIIYITTSSLLRFKIENVFF
jgi:hypothetical protein